MASHVMLSDIKLSKFILYFPDEYIVLFFDSCLLNTCPKVLSSITKFSILSLSSRPSKDKRVLNVDALKKASEFITLAYLSALLFDIFLI